MVTYHNTKLIEDSSIRVFRKCFLCKAVYEGVSGGHAFYKKVQDSSPKFVLGDILKSEDLLIFKFNNIPEKFCITDTQNGVAIHYLLGLSEDLTLGTKITKYSEVPTTSSTQHIETGKFCIRALEFSGDSLNANTQCYSLVNNFKSEILVDNYSNDLTLPEFLRYESINSKDQILNLYSNEFPSY